MTATTKEERGVNETWLRRMADAEDRCESVAAAGLAAELGLLHAMPIEKPRVLGRLIEFSRRARGLSVERLADEADVDLGELVALEREEDVRATPRTVYKLAKLLGVSTGKLMVLAGLADAEDTTLKEAALRFAARSEPTAQLSKGEREALEEFVKVLVERSDGGA